MLLEKLYSLIDSIESLPFIWDDYAYQCHVESVCQALGEYVGGNWAIKRKDRNWWVLVELGNNAMTSFTNLWDTVREFVQLQPRPELV